MPNSIDGQRRHQVLRLKYAPRAVAEYIRRAAVIGITWPIPEGLADAALERKMFCGGRLQSAAIEPAAVRGALRRTELWTELLRALSGNLRVPGRRPRLKGDDTAGGH